MTLTTADSEGAGESGARDIEKDKGEKEREWAGGSADTSVGQVPFLSAFFFFFLLVLFVGRSFRSSSAKWTLRFLGS